MCDFRGLATIFSVCNYGKIVQKKLVELGKIGNRNTIGMKSKQMGTIYLDKNYGLVLGRLISKVNKMNLMIMICRKCQYTYQHMYVL